MLIKPNLQNMPLGGFELGSPAWQPGAIPITPQQLYILCKTQDLSETQVLDQDL